jgi:hypothetical protein
MKIIVSTGAAPADTAAAGRNTFSVRQSVSDVFTGHRSLGTLEHFCGHAGEYESTRRDDDALANGAAYRKRVVKAAKGTPRNAATVSFACHTPVSFPIDEEITGDVITDEGNSKHKKKPHIISV